MPRNMYKASMKTRRKKHKMFERLQLSHILHTGSRLMLVGKRRKWAPSSRCLKSPPTTLKSIDFPSLFYDDHLSLSQRRTTDKTGRQQPNYFRALWSPHPFFLSFGGNEKGRECGGDVILLARWWAGGERVQPWHRWGERVSWIYGRRWWSCCEQGRRNLWTEGIPIRPSGPSSTRSLPPPPARMSPVTFPLSPPACCSLNPAKNSSLSRPQLLIIIIISWNNKERLSLTSLLCLCVRDGWVRLADRHTPSSTGCAKSGPRGWYHLQEELLLKQSNHHTSKLVSFLCLGSLCYFHLSPYSSLARSLRMLREITSNQNKVYFIHVLQCSLDLSLFANRHLHRDDCRTPTRSGGRAYGCTDYHSFVAVSCSWAEMLLCRDVHAQRRSGPRMCCWFPWTTWELLCETVLRHWLHKSMANKRAMLSSGAHEFLRL